VFSQLQALLGEDLKKTKLVSISIDPEYDTPPRLRDYAKKFSALPQWRHYTGTREASLAVQKAFHAYRGDKMNHFPVTFLRGAPRRPWIRLEGFATPDVLAREYREAVRNA
jgi:protein SCO1/2